MRDFARKSKSKICMRVLIKRRFWDVGRIIFVQILRDSTHSLLSSDSAKPTHATMMILAPLDISKT